MRMITRAVAAIVLTMSAMLAPASADAYSLGSSARFTDAAIGDGILTVCYGINTTEGIWVNRSELALAMARTWGEMGQFNGRRLTFASNGLCDNDGSNIEIKWDRTRYTSCGPGIPIAWVNGPPVWYYNNVTIWMNARCNIEGELDWQPSDGTLDWTYSASRVVMHEVGHALGLAHSSAPEALMYDASTPGIWCPIMAFYQEDQHDDYWGFVDEYRYVPGFVALTPNFDLRCRP